MTELLENRSNLLRTMYRKQYELQLYMKEKRNLKSPPDPMADFIEHEHVLAAIYFSSCVNIEWMELEESYRQYLDLIAYSEDATEEDINSARVRALEELVDVWHFLLSVFIFLGLKEEQAAKLVHFGLGDVGSLAEYAGSTSMALSSVLASAPYKTWKDQDNVKVLSKEYKDLLYSKFSVCFNNVLDFAVCCLDSNYEEFVKVYLVKNALNFRRQENKELGYLG